jgi:hypothetical protein
LEVGAAGRHFQPLDGTFGPCAARGATRHNAAKNGTWQNAALARILSAFTIRLHSRIDNTRKTCARITKKHVDNTRETCARIVRKHIHRIYKCITKPER